MTGSTGPRNRRNRYGETWEETVTRIHRQYPTTRNGNWALLLNDDKLPAGHPAIGGLARILLDLIRVTDDPHQRRGSRSVPDVELGELRLRELFGLEYTVLPFDEAFRALAGPRSRTNLARRTGLSRTQVHRLLVGDILPSGADMEAVAGAFGKKPTYFREYRSGAVLAALADHFDQSPESSIGLVRKLGVEEALRR